LNHGFSRAWLTLRHTLTLKVLVVLLLGGMALHTLAVQGFRLAREAEGHRTGTSMAKAYALSLLPALGDPPRLERARALAAPGLWDFRFESPAGSWATDPGVPASATAMGWAPSEGWGWHNGQFFLVQRYPSGILTIQADTRIDHSIPMTWTLSLALSLFGVLALVWLALRWLLAPIAWLNEGMTRIADGDLDHSIPTRDGDELGRLAQQFNAMTGQVKAMLDQRRQLLLDVSHELRTPLTRLKLGLEALPESSDKASLAEDVQVLELLVAELLEGARLAHGRSQLHLEQVDLCQLVRDGAHEFQGQEPGVRLDLPTELALQGDPMRLQRLFLNLLANAHAHGVPARGPIQVSLSRSSASIRLLVQDQGPGVAPAVLNRLFTPFFRADPSRNRGGGGGVGLGLHLCRRIAEAHGGTLTAALPPEGGLAMTLELPIG
jgi:signal transduction histidine kinase